MILNIEVRGFIDTEENEKIGTFAAVLQNGFRDLN